jgi:hypothetical protein
MIYFTSMHHREELGQATGEGAIGGGGAVNPPGGRGKDKS